MLIQYKQKVEVEGHGEYEITINNLVNPVTMKSITTDHAFLDHAAVISK
jgi:hypothetical protein